MWLRDRITGKQWFKKGPQKEPTAQNSQQNGLAKEWFKYGKGYKKKKIVVRVVGSKPNTEWFKNGSGKRGKKDWRVVDQE